jgi:hypothetical protein
MRKGEIGKAESECLLSFIVNLHHFNKSKKKQDIGALNVEVRKIIYMMILIFLKQSIGGSDGRS